MIYWQNLSTLAGKRLRVREPAWDTNQNGFLGKKCRVDAEIHQIIIYKSLALLRPENIMHDVEAKLSAMHLGGRKRVLYYVILKLVLKRNMCECILYFYSEICGIPENVPRFMKNAFHIPEDRHLGLASLIYRVFKFLS